MDRLINIYRLVNGVQTKICAISKENATLYQGIMDKDKVMLSVVTEEPIYLFEGDYILLDGIKYKINRDPEDKQSSEKEHSYEFSLEAPIYTLIDKIYCNKITGSTTVTLTGKLRDFLELLVWNVNYDAVSNPLGIDTGWTIGLCPDTEYMNITLEAVKCRDALNTFADKFGVEYYVSNKTVNYVAHIENERGLAFTQGEGGGLYDIERKNVDDGDLVTRAYIKGGTDNVISGEGDEKGRLILPEVYLENFSESIRGIEAEVVFSEIHPTFQGVVRTVSGNDNREFLCPEIDFDVAELAVGDEARVNFLTGDLMGKSFEFKWNNSSKKITLIYQEDDLAIIDPSTGSRPNIPSSSKYLRGGELFNFTGIKLGGSYKTNAIAKLREKGLDWLAYYSRKRVKFELNVDYRYLRKNHIELHCGDLITINVPLHNISKLIRVTAIERNLYTGKLTCTVSNYLDEKWRDKIENQIAEIKSSSTTVNGGYGGATSVTILEKNDEREPSDSNVFSSRRALEEIKNKALSRLNDDTAAGLITFLQGINVGQFTTGMLGSGGAITVDPATGKTRIEADELLVRMKAYFYELMIEKLSHVGGQIVLTPAGITCIKVEELPNAYRCYFKSTDGEKTISNDFVIGDQATRREFNIKSTVQDGTNRYYWRLVTGIGDDYIDLSITDCDTNSDVPLVGDEIVQLGNRVDHSRQSAIMLSAFGTDSPSIKQYTGIDAYSLVDKEVTVVSPHGNRFVGDFILSTGTNLATQMKVLENLIKTEIQSIEHWINDEANFLKNASFSLNMDGWQSESALKVFTAKEPLVVNGEYYADAAKIAEVVSHENKYMLRLKDSFVKQLNSDLDHPDKASTFYISFRYLCEATGTLTCGFEGQELYQTVILNPNRQACIFEYSGIWDGTGDFILQFTGDIYISLVTLTNRPLDDFKKEVTSKFEQTATSLRAVVESVDNIDQTIKESGWLTEKDGTKIWASCTFSDGTKAMSLFNVTPEGIFMDGSHINLKGLVTFESFSTDFQTAYQQAFGNASMTAKDDVARQLGYTNYAQLVANAATSGKAIMIGGYLNLNLIDVATLLAGKVISAKVVTALSGKRIEIDPQKNAIMVYDGQNREIAKIYFIEHENGQSSAGVSLAQLNAAGKYEYYTSIVPGGVTIDRGYIINPASDNWERLELSPGGITFMKNGVVTKIISGQ